jgi:UDP-glucuronate decarboxylase
LLDGCQVICADNFSSSAEGNIGHIVGDPNFELIRHDIVAPLHAEVDEIYNLGCPASPVNYQRDPIQTMKTSVLGSINMLELAKRVGARILQASTSEVYGDPQVHPQRESYWGNVNPVGIRACYDEGKRCAETLFFDYQRKYNLDIRVVRIFNTYGPRMQPDDGRVVSNFLIQALTNQNITIYGDGTQTRSFQFVDDLINGMLTMMRNTDSFSGPVNLGNPLEFTIKELAEKILQLIPESTSRIIHKPLPSDDPLRRKPDITLAAKKLDWEPKVHLDDGLNRTIEYFRAGMDVSSVKAPASS